MDLISKLNQMDIEDLKSMYYTMEKRCEMLEERCSKLENKLNAVKQKQAKKYSDTLRALADDALINRSQPADIIDALKAGAESLEDKEEK